MAEDRDQDIDMVVESVRVHMRTGRHVLLLKEIGLGRILPVWIGPWEASAIAAHSRASRPSGRSPTTCSSASCASWACAWTGS